MCIGADHENGKGSMKGGKELFCQESFHRIFVTCARRVQGDDLEEQRDENTMIRPIASHVT